MECAVSNAVVNERTKLPDVPSLIADRRHSLFGHICRLPQALQLSIEAHTGTPPAADWKRPPGRPRRNWLQQLEEDTGLSVGAAWIAGQDRLMWRTLRPSAGQAQQWVSEWVRGIEWCYFQWPRMTPDPDYFKGTPYSTLIISETVECKTLTRIYLHTTYSTV